jgi:hypothetical protein
LIAAHLASLTPIAKFFDCEQIGKETAPRVLER